METVEGVLSEGVLDHPAETSCPDESGFAEHLEVVAQEVGCDPGGSVQMADAGGTVRVELAEDSEARGIADDSEKRGLCFE